MLVLLVARMAGFREDRHIQLATVIEFLHTATLLHDDVIDGSMLRRRRQTVNAKWGNSASVLVGDFLYSRAFQVMVDIGDLRVLQLLSESTNIIAEGEVMQLAHMGDADLGEENYREIIRRKTAMLFQASSHTAAVLSGIRAKDELAMRDYGLHLGMAYQLVDDVLDYCGDTKSFGKNIGDDLAEGKLTLPIIYTLVHGDRQQRSLIRYAIEHRDLSCLDDLTKAMNAVGALDYTKAAARHECDKAIACLAQQPDNAYRRALEDLAAFVVQRQY